MQWVTCKAKIFHWIGYLWECNQWREKIKREKNKRRRNYIIPATSGWYEEVIKKLWEMRYKERKKKEWKHMYEKVCTRNELCLYRKHWEEWCGEQHAHAGRAG